MFIFCNINSYFSFTFPDIRNIIKVFVKSLNRVNIANTLILPVNSIISIDRMQLKSGKTSLNPVYCTCQKFGFDDLVTQLTRGLHNFRLTMYDNEF